MRFCILQKTPAASDGRRHLQIDYYYGFRAGSSGLSLYHIIRLYNIFPGYIVLFLYIAVGMQLKAAFFKHSSARVIVGVTARIDPVACKYVEAVFNAE